MSSAHDAIGPQFEITPIKREELGNSPMAETSRGVSREEYQVSAARGRDYLARVSQTPQRGLDRRWEDVKSHAYEATREPWGGATISAKTGKPMSGKANAYALTARPPGEKQITVSTSAHPDEFHEALKKGKEQLASSQGTHLGVFHDADRGRIDIDPVVVTRRRSDAEDVGAYTRATGGAYHFRSGNGYAPPHVKED